MDMTLLMPSYMMEGGEACGGPAWSSPDFHEEPTNYAQAFGFRSTSRVQQVQESSPDSHEEPANHAQAFGFRSTSRVQMDAQVQEAKGWEILSLEEALTSLEQMAQLPSVENFMCILKKCRKRKNSSCAKCVYLHLCYNGLESHRLLRNHLIPMLVECGKMPDAEQVFCRFAQQNACFWPSLLEGYLECGEYQYAFELFHQMQLDCAQLNKYALQALLKACARLKWIKQGQEVHAGLIREGLETDTFVGNSLVEMYVKCGSLAEAREVFDELSTRDVVGWTVLSSGYADCGQDGEALRCLEQMRMEGVFPNAVTFVSGLKACGRTGSLERGQELHAEIAKEGFESEIFVGSTLLDMYAKCGQLAEAQEVFDGLLVRDVVSWTALIAGYGDHGHGTVALDCFNHMQSEGVLPNAVTFICTLKACGNIGAIARGREIHAEVAKEEFEKDPVIGSAVVGMYVKCDSLEEAWAVFEELPARDVVLWTALIAGYAEHGLDEEVLSCLEKMQMEGVPMDSIMFVHSLKACGSIEAINRGQKIHAEIVKEGFECNSFVGSTLMDMYAKGGLLGEALEVFDELPVRDVVSWTALMTGYVEHGLCKEAMMCLEQMQLEGVFPNDVTLVCSLQACGGLGSMEMGQEVHSRIVSGGFERDPFVGNALVDFYAKGGLLAEAWKVFDQLVVQDVVSWNTLITGFSEHGLGQEALNFLLAMQLEGMFPNDITLVCCLKACSSLGAIDKGQEIHVEIAKVGFERDPFVGNTLVDMYTKCGLLAEAFEVFDKLLIRDVVSWNILIAGCAEHRLGERGLACLEQMQVDGVVPNIVTLVYGLKCCGSITALEGGQELHAEIIRKGCEIDAFVGSALVDMYARCGWLTEAQEVFDELSARDVAWNALVAGYTEHGFDKDVLACFEKMQAEGMSPDAVTFVCALKACGSMGAIDRGQEVHILAVKKGFEHDPYVGNILVDMYAKCGILVEACELFDKLTDRDIVSWSAIIAGYARQGESEVVFQLFKEMEEEGVRPDEITLLSVLTACSHAGLLDKGQEYFKVMSEKYSISPTIEHHNCMIDLLSRAGQLDKAMSMLTKMPFEPNFVTWSTMLGACRKWGNGELGGQVFELTLRSNDKEAAAFNLMYNIYADADVWEQVKKVDMNV